MRQEYDVGSLRDKSGHILLIVLCEVLSIDWELLCRRHERSLRNVSKVDDVDPEWIGVSHPPKQGLWGFNSFKRVCSPVSPCCPLCSRIVYQEV